MRRNPIMLAAMVVGLLAIASTAVMFMRKKKATTEEEKETVRVLVATMDITTHVRITSGMVEPRDVKSTEAEDGVARRVSDVVDRVPLTKIAKGSFIYLSNLGPKPSSSRPVLSFPVMEARRVMGIIVDPATDVGGLAAIGDHVDVLVSYDRDTTDQSLCRTVAQDLEVVGTELLGKPKKSSSSKGEGEEEAPPTSPEPNTVKMRVLVLVTPEQAQDIVAAEEKGELTLIIRNPEDREIVSLKDSREHPTETGNETTETKRSTSRTPSAAQQVAAALAAQRAAEAAKAAGTPVQVVKGTQSEVIVVHE